MATEATEVVIEVAGSALGVEPGAEIAGTVVEAGQGTGEWIGRRVVIPRLLPCGDCDLCRRGRVAHCPGRRTRSEGARQTVPARWLVSVEPPLWPEGAALWQLAALADAALSPYTALCRAGVGPGDTVVVVGNDARAAFVAALAAAKGARALVDEGTLSPRPGAFVFATGVSARERALALVEVGGTVVLLDGPGPDRPLSVDWGRLLRTEAQLFGVTGGHPDLLPELCALCVRGQLPLGEWVEPVTAQDAARAASAYRERGGRLPIVLP